MRCGQFWLMGYPGQGPPKKGNRATRQRSALGLPIDQLARQRDLSVTVQPVTKMRYTAHLQRFNVWLTSVELMSLEELAEQGAEAMDRGLRAYIHKIYLDHSPITWARETVASVQSMWPHFRGNLRGAWGHVRVWLREEPLQMRVPIPHQVLLAIVSTCIVFDDLTFGTLLLLAYHALLRPQDIISAMRSHLFLPSDGSARSLVAVLTLIDSKTKYTGARLQSVVIDDPILVQLLMRVFGSHRPSRLLSPYDMVTFVKRFVWYCNFLGLPEGLFSLAGLRAGGATDHFNHFANIAALQYRGRWDSIKSVSHYVQQANGILALSRLDPITQGKVDALAAVCGDLLNIT